MSLRPTADPWPESEGGSDDLRQAAEDLALLAGRVPLLGADGLHAVGAAIHELVRSIRLAEVRGRTPEEIADALAPAREAHARSPLFRKMQAGDPGVAASILEGRNLSTPGTFGWWLESLLVHGPLGSALRARPERQAEALDLAARLATPARPASILLVGSGAMAAVRRAAPALESAAVRFLLLEEDPDAIEPSLERLGPVRARIGTRCGPLVDSLAGRPEDRPHDLVLADEPVDLLPEPRAAALLAHAAAALRPGSGRLLLSGLASGNPWRTWVEGCGGWTLPHRSEDDVRRLAARAGIGPGGLVVERDGTRLAWRASIRRPAAPPTGGTPPPPARG